MGLRRGWVPAIALVLLLSGCTPSAGRPGGPGRGGPTGSTTPPARVQSGPGVIVQLFEWTWPDVARECTEVLGPKGYGAVQISPPQEHVVLADRGYPWWQRYQPVSYALTSRGGGEAALRAMVEACHRAGVKVYADAVVNHMSAELTGVGSAGTAFRKYDYPGLYRPDDFHRCPRSITNWADRTEVQECELLGLADLDTGKPAVREKIVGYLNHLLALGVDGFRLDAAKHIPVADLDAITARLSRPAYLYAEVIQSAGAVQSTEYEHLGSVLEFRYGDTLSGRIRSGNLAALAEFAKPGLGWTPSERAVVFVDNHDTQRDGEVLSAVRPDERAAYRLAQVFELAWPYGTPLVMSSYTFDGRDQGPPSDAAGHTAPVRCGDTGWLCEHRWRSAANMVRFRAVAGTAPVGHWDAPSDFLVGFAREGRGFVVLNWGPPTTRAFRTGLPAGVYCDLVHGDAGPGGACTGPTVTVDAGGTATVRVAGTDAVAIAVAP